MITGQDHGETEARLNVFQKQIELSLRQIRALCFRKLLELKPRFFEEAAAADHDAILDN